MTLNVKLRLTSPFLGEMLPDRSGVRRFRKQGNCILIDSGHWLEQFRQAAHFTGTRVDCAAVFPPSVLLAASYHNYRREYSKVKVEHFESFRKGTILSTQLEIMNKPQAPTLEQMKHILDYVGAQLGLSPWGSKFGFGRFEVYELTKSC